MTDNEIIKALECCIAEGEMMCNKCPLKSECAHNPLDDIKVMHALNLINRQKAEIERLTALVEAAEDYLNPLPFKNAFDEEIEKTKIEAIKEFAERLIRDVTMNNTNDGYLDYSVDYNCLIEDIDNLVKEMTEEAN